jgi:hypothetical protein
VVKNRRSHFIRKPPFHAGPRHSKVSGSSPAGNLIDANEHLST